MEPQAHPHPGRPRTLQVPKGSSLLHFQLDRESRKFCSHVCLPGRHSDSSIRTALPPSLSWWAPARGLKMERKEQSLLPHFRK